MKRGHAAASASAEDDPPQRPIGLVNLGNSCFQAAVMQALTHTPGVRELVRLAERSTMRQEMPIMQLFLSLALEMKNSTQAAVEPIALVDALVRVGNTFQIKRMEDAHEYMRCLLNVMHEEERACWSALGRTPAPTTMIKQVFGGALCNKLICPLCTSSSETSDAFCDLSMSIEQGPASVLGALGELCKQEMLQSGPAADATGPCWQPRLLILKRHRTPSSSILNDSPLTTTKPQRFAKKSTSKKG